MAPLGSMSRGSGADNDLATQHPQWEKQRCPQIPEMHLQQFRKQPSPPFRSPEADRQVTVDRGGFVEQTHHGRDEAGPVHRAGPVTSQNKCSRQGWRDSPRTRKCKYLFQSGI